MKRIFLSLLIIPFLGVATAQTAWDGLLFSQNYYGGTARFTAMGGAFTALGGDLSALNINPAGIGVFRNWELSITPAVTYNLTDATYLNNKASDSYTNFGLDNLGLVFGVYDNTNESMPISFNLGITFNRMNQYHKRTSASGISRNSSFVGALAVATDRINPADLDAQDAYNKTSNWSSVMAWRTYLIDVLPNTTDQYYGTTETIRPDGTIVVAGDLRQDYFKEESGNTVEYLFSFGGNIYDVFHFGIGFGFQSIWQDVKTTISEAAVNPSNFETGFNSMSYYLDMGTRGVGYNIKLGVLLRPIAGLRWGAYFHSPTWMSLTNHYWEERMNAKYDVTATAPAAFYSEQAPASEYDYSITTPIKWGTGLAYVIGNNAVVSVEYEGQDFSTTKMRGHNHAKLPYVGGDTKYMYEDDYTKDNFKLVSNIRAGVEYRLPQLSFRLGYAYYGSPVKNNDNLARNIFALGLGYRNNGFYVDGTYSFSPNMDNNYTIYTDSPIMTTNSYFGKIAVTVGFRF